MNMITTNTGTLNRGANKENRWDKLTNHQIKGKESRQRQEHHMCYIWHVTALSHLCSMIKIAIFHKES